MGDRGAPFVARSVVSWFVWSLLFSLSAGQYASATADVFTPAVLSQAVAAAICCLRAPSSSKSDDGAAADAISSSSSSSSSSSRRRGWMLGIGLLQCLVSVLTLASFAATSVADTLVVRMLEPVCSCILVFIVHGRKCSRAELLLVTGAATSHVVLAARPSTGTASSLWSGSNSSINTAWLAGSARYASLCLAVMATLLVSCRSVASKAVAAASRTTEFDVFLEASVPGLAGALILQCAMQAYSRLLLPGPESGGLSSSLPVAQVASALLLCAVSQYAYSSASSQVLQVCSPVVHSLLNVCKRVMMIVASSVLLGHPLTITQLASLAVASLAAALFAVIHQAGGSATTATGARSASKAALLSGGSSPPEPATGSGGALRRLAWVVGLTLVLSAVCLGCVIPTLHAAPARFALSAQQGQQQQQQHLSSKWHLLPSHDPTASQELRDAAAALLHPSTTQGGAGGAAASALDSLSPNARRYVAEEIGRLQCLTALHNASKAALAPFLANRTHGGIALFDVALHKNLGDAVLWAAAARLVPAFHDSVKYVCAQAQLPGRGSAEALKHFPKCNIPRMLQAIGPQGVVLLAPGGNWGDLWWPVHSQRLKYLQALAAAHRNTSRALQVVQLPQSLSFSGDKTVAKDDSVINSLPASMLTLFARQEASLEYARAHYPHTRLLAAPDLALSLGPLMPGGEPAFDVLFLMRQDKEAQGSEQHVRPSSETTAGAAAGRQGAQQQGDASAGATDDTLEQLSNLNLTYSMREWDYAFTNFSKEASQVALPQLAESRLQGAIDIISQGKVVVTNRLHAAIMANLVGRPLIWIDTQQKKLSGVRSLAWTYSSACTEANLHSVQAPDFASAVATAARWLAAPDFTWSVQQVQLQAHEPPSDTAGSLAR